jgi:hypothetical protein
LSKQQKTYLLLIAVIGIWGMIIYQIFKETNTDTSTPTSTIQKKFIPQKIQQKKEDTLDVNYRDPFLGKVSRKIVRKKATDPKQPIYFPVIIYNGSIIGNKKTAYIISVQNQQKIIKIGQTFKDVTLVSANSNEIIIAYKKERKTIKLQQ